MPVLSLRAIPRHLACFSAVVAALLLAQPDKASAKDKDVEAAIAGGIVGIAVGAALSQKHHHSPQVYYPGYRPPYAPGGYNPYFARSFSPAPGVMCYDAQAACYDADGTFSNKWMRRIYGR